MKEKFNPLGKPTWSVDVTFVTFSGDRHESSWTIIASSPNTACQRGISGARRQMARDRTPGRSRITRVHVNASPNQ